MKRKTFGGYAGRSLAVTALLGSALGLFLLLADVNFLFGIVFVVLGILTVFNNLPGLVLGAVELHTTAGKLLFSLSLISTMLGVIMIFYHNEILMILLGVYFVLMPIVRLILAKDRSELFRRELPKLVLGVVMILLGPAGVVSILFRIAGITVLILTAIYVVTTVRALRRLQHKTGSRVFVDTDGNGKCDVLYVDTTGDGKADTATPYKEEQ